MIYLLGTLLVASKGSRGSSALSAVLGVLCFDFFFVPPRFTFSVSDAEYVFTFVVMFLTAMLISHLAIRLRSEAEEARLGQKQTAMMYEFSQRLSSAHGVKNVLNIAVSQIGPTFSCDAIAFMPGQDGRLEVIARSGGPQEISEKDRAVAHWVYDAGQSAGLGTNSLPESDALFLPIVGTEKTVGVLCAVPRDSENLSGVDQQKFLNSFAHQIGMALEVERLEDNARRTEVEVETERLRSALLSSVSHDLRTPLTVIVGSASTLLQMGARLEERQTRELLESIQSEGERLSHLVQNLLETTRLESGTVKMKKEVYPLEEVIGSALERLKKSLEGYDLKIQLPENLPPVPMDCLLLEQVFVNLLENAIRYTPPQRSIEISADAGEDAVTVAISDSGSGLKRDELERVFEKFYRGPSSHGAGLGLAICRAIVKAHGGKIWAENRPEGGAAFQFTLPLGERHAK